MALCTKNVNYLDKEFIDTNFIRKILPKINTKFPNANNTEFMELEMHANKMSKNNIIIPTNRLH